MFLERVESVLALSPHFRDLPATTRSRLARGTRQAELRDGERFEGVFAIILEGALQLSVPARRRSATVAILGAGSFFSVSALVCVPPATPLRRAVGRTSLAVVPMRRLHLLLHEDAALKAHVATLIGTRLDAMVALFGDATGVSLPCRLARRLMAQLLAGGRPDAGPIELSLSQSMLAEILGVSRSSVHDELAQLEAGGVLRRAYRRIVVLDTKRLRRVAGKSMPPL